MNKNYLTQVVALFMITIGILLALSTIPPTHIDFTTRQVDLLSSLRNKSIDSTYIDETELPDSLLVECDSTTQELPIAMVAPVNEQTDSMNFITPVVVARKEGNLALIEDYSPTQEGLKHIVEAITMHDQLHRPIRIGVLGDSFIEADILTQNIRQLLQDRYGGCGVGYMAMHSDFPGFRRSIQQTDKGWSTHNVSSNEQMEYFSLPLQLHRPDGNGEAYTKLKGVTRLRHIEHWEVTKVGFIALDSATITIKTDSTSHTYEIAPDEVAQFITLAEPTHSVEVRCSNPNVAFWGCWLDGRDGIAVDNISIRGYSGTTLAGLPIIHVQKLVEKIPYDLIILQYGLNRMTPSITDYSYYTKQLIEAIEHLRKAAPHSDILIAGIGDRCQNEDGTLQTMQAVYGILKAQRNAAIATQSLFWDCCEAMKSLGGMPTFVENKWANKDYTHINHAGGQPLAEEFVKAFVQAIEKQSSASTHPSDTTSHE